MIKGILMGFVIAFASFVITTAVVHAQTTTTSPAPTSTSTNGTNTPSGAPQTGFGQ